MLTLYFLKIFGSKSQFPGGNSRFANPADVHESSPPYLYEKHNVLENISSDQAILVPKVVTQEISEHHKLQQIFVISTGMQGRRKPF